MVTVITKEQALAVIQRLSVQEVKHYPELNSETDPANKETKLKQAIGVRLKDLSKEDQSNIEIETATDGYVTQEQLTAAINKRLKNTDNIDTTALKSSLGKEVTASDYTQELTDEQKNYIWETTIIRVTGEAPKEKPDESSTVINPTQTNPNTPKPTVNNKDLGEVDVSDTNASIKVNFDTPIKPARDDKSINVKIDNVNHTLTESQYSIENNQTLVIKKDTLNSLGITENNGTEYSLSINSAQLANYANKAQTNDEISGLTFKTKAAAAPTEYSIDTSTPSTIKLGTDTQVTFNQALPTNLDLTTLSQSIYFLELNDAENPVNENDKKKLTAGKNVTINNKTLTIPKDLPLRAGKKYRLVIPENALNNSNELTFDFNVNN